MDYTVYIAQPPGYLHSAAFTELAELVAYGLGDLGHDARVAVNRLRPGTTPIVIGCHLMDVGMMRQMPSGTIITTRTRPAGIRRRP